MNSILSRLAVTLTHPGVVPVGATSSRASAEGDEFDAAMVTLNSLSARETAMAPSSSPPKTKLSTTLIAWNAAYKRAEIAVLMGHFDAKNPASPTREAYFEQLERMPRAALASLLQTTIGKVPYSKICEIADRAVTELMKNNKLDAPRQAALQPRG